MKNKIDLKITIHGKEYVAPEPLGRHYGEYVKALSGEKKEESVTKLICSFFQSGDVTPETFDNASFSEVFILETTWADWLQQFIPEQSKNEKAQ